VAPQLKSTESFKVPQDLMWKAGPGPSVRLYPPEVLEGSEGGKGVQLRPPDVLGSDKPALPKLEGATELKASVFPVGIPQFAQVRNQVASGLRPSLDDGLDWLAANGYKTVLYLHAPGEADGPDRKQVEKRGMKFISVELSPATLALKTIDEFNHIVQDGTAMPLFVYDRDGSLAGSMWYLHFRWTQQAPDEAARLQARALGLREDRDGMHREMWQATQKYLREKSQ
jgi:hypothetical protein